MVRMLGIQYNSDGRPCMWAEATGKTEEEAKAKAQALMDNNWSTHGGSGAGCYPGEEKGEVQWTNKGRPW